MEDKKSKIIGIIIVIVILLIISGLVALGVVLFANKGDDNSETKQENEISFEGSSKAASNGGTALNAIDVDSANGKKKMMEGYEIIGTIEIPKTDLKANILAETTKRSLEIAITQMYTTSALNKPGNTVLYGHNYRNTQFFSRNDELQKGDEVYITDNEDHKIKYIIYDKFETSSTDTSFYTRTASATDGKCEITLSTCTDDASTTDRRIILLAREE